MWVLSCRKPATIRMNRSSSMLMSARQVPMQRCRLMTNCQGEHGVNGHPRPPAEWSDPVCQRHRLRGNDSTPRRKPPQYCRPPGADNSHGRVLSQAHGKFAEVLGLTPLSKVLPEDGTENHVSVARGCRIPVAQGQTHNMTADEVMQRRPQHARYMGGRPQESQHAATALRG